MRRCSQCQKNKQNIEFYKDKRIINGLYSICKHCFKKKYGYRSNRVKKLEYHKQYALKNPEKIKKIQLLYREKHPDGYKKARKKYEKLHDKTPERRRQRNETAKRMYKKYPEKWKARSLARFAVKKGIIIKKPCFFCGNKKVEGHHEDYKKPLEVIWLCKKHHTEKHYGIIK